jgi:hypothetical protein
VAAHSLYKTIDELRGKKAAISRFGSGSHLMSFVNAQNNNWDLNKDLDFKVVDSFEGGVKALAHGSADYLLWEKFTTKPIVDNDVFRRIGDCPTPWPCFVIAAREPFIQENEHMLETILAIINNKTRGFKVIPYIDSLIAKRYNQRLTDVREWLSMTQWSQESFNEKLISNIQRKLLAINIIPEIYPYSKLVRI